MTIEDADIEAIVGEVWNGFIGLATWPAPDSDQPVEGPTLDGRVEIDGAWRGAVLVRCPVDLAQLAAARLLGGEPSGPDEVLDAVGEIANQTGSNIRSLLPGPTTLSLPSVAIAAEARAGAGEDARTLRRLAFACGGELFTVAVIGTR